MQGFDGWLTDGDAPEADWAPRITQMALRGELGRAGPKWLLDLPALAQPHACRPATCHPALRPKTPKTRSCCADIEVTVSPAERAAITAALPELGISEDAAFTELSTLKRPGRRCVFADADLSCRLHQLEDQTGRPRGALKPTPCRLFPLAVVDLGDGRRLLTAVHRATARLLSAPPAKSFPCLRDPGLPPLIETEAALVGELLGRQAPAARRAVAAWREAQQT